ncbi:MAG: 7-carboxy-7-deazaguanine synthase [Kiritimatiellia bacterium]|jgi:7-carboxy-7-deazaguanine synthase
MSSPGKLTVNEIFFSIQGESSHIGLPCIFVRLAFCNLRCSWCDSTYTFYEGQELSFDQVMDQIREYPCKLVELTGGEPLAQEEAFPFMTRLCDEGYEVIVETSGSLDISRTDPRVKRIMDLKCPGSGMVARNRYKNIESLRPDDEIKFVIKDRHDYEWAKQTIDTYGLNTICPIIFSPVFDALANIELAQWMLDDGVKARFQMQLHKYIWDPAQRGV